jgi:LuxR family transcriptional regulator, maltose regulon positive regulatory protein
MALRLRWLGHPRVEQDGRPVRFEMRKAIALLAYLSLERREHAREALASLLWPEDDQEHALGSLRRALASLHKSIEPARVASSRDALTLPPGGSTWLDVDAFRQLLAGAKSHHHSTADICPRCRAGLEQAVALYQGDFLDGFTLPACPAFDDWQLFQRESLRRELALALARLAERLAAEGDWEPAISVARRWVGLDPLHEPAHRLLIELYSQAGERGAALRQYERCREALAAELGQEPDATTVFLYEQIASAGPPVLHSAGESPARAAGPTALSGASLPPARLQDGEPLIRTKLRLPFSRPELVVRPRLQEQVARGLRGPLTLLTAPAGYGKTTLLASCIAGCRLPAAWLSLDRNDNQVGRFLRYLLAAVEEVDPSLARGAAQLLTTARPAAPQAILTNLVNDLDASSRELALVLDDYQFVRSRPVHESVAFLVEHAPANLHIVIASRSDPPLPLSKLRARGQTVELRAADLSFTEAEAGQFLNGVMGLGLDAVAVAALAGRTEGWIAGLQMAALSMREREDVPGFIDGFSGTNRYILDYLLEEVLTSQPAETQQFLLATSILERLTAPLCDALLDHVDGEQGGPAPAAPDVPGAGHSAAVLDYLERANVFLVPLDDERIWYRYHHLFADLLRAQLQRTRGTAGVAGLHARAAGWHEQHGSLVEAIHHAALAADEEMVERFVQRSYAELVSRGEQSWIRSWSGELSADLVYSRPWLCIYDAYSHSWFGELDEAERLLAEAEKQLPAATPASAAQAMQGLLAYVQSRVTAMRGDLPRAIELCQQARAFVPPTNLALQLDTGITLGYEYFLMGDYANARPLLSETIRLGMRTGAVINTVAASCVLARLCAVEGRLRESEDHYQTAARLIPKAGGQHLGARALVEIGLADLFCERNDLDAALAHLQRGLDWLPWWGKRDDLALAHVTLARIHLARGRTRVAREAIDRACRLVKVPGVFCEARHAVESMQVGVWLAAGDLQAAGRWAAALDEHSRADKRLGFENELAWLARARILMAQNQPSGALSLLSPLEEGARSAGRMGRVVELVLLEALALQAKGESNKAMAALARCLTLAEPEGYVRLFLDEGRPAQLLLAAWLARASPGPLRDYAVELLAHFKSGPTLLAAAPETGSLVEPLSPRELEVLQLIAAGKTNQQIALDLIIAPGTVKAHTGNIYRKLDVANRTEAVARARQLGILA